MLHKYSYTAIHGAYIQFHCSKCCGRYTRVLEPHGLALVVPPQERPDLSIPSRVGKELLTRWRRKCGTL